MKYEELIDIFNFEVSELRWRYHLMLRALRLIEIRFKNPWYAKWCLEHNGYNIEDVNSLEVLELMSWMLSEIRENFIYGKELYGDKARWETLYYYIVSRMKPYGERRKRRKKRKRKQ